MYFFLIKFEETKETSLSTEFYKRLYQSRQSQSRQSQSRQSHKRKDVITQQVFKNILSRQIYISSFKKLIYNELTKKNCSEDTDLELIKFLYEAYENDYNEDKLNELNLYLNELLQSNDILPKNKIPIEDFIFEIEKFFKKRLSKEDFKKFFLNIFSHYLYELFWNCDYFSKFIKIIWKDEFPTDFFELSGGNSKPRIKKVIRKY